MRSVPRFLAAALCGLALTAGTVSAADMMSGMTQGTADLKSAGPLAFGPDGVLFVGDPTAATIFAIATGDTSGSATGPVKMPKIDEKMGQLLGTTAADLRVADMAVNPAS